MRDDQAVTEPAPLEPELIADIARGEDPRHPVRLWLADIRAYVKERPWLNFAYRIFIAAVGSVIVLAGIVMLFTPGQGLLTIFLGLAILATEFHWAHRVSVATKRQLSRFWAWWRDWRDRRRWRRARRAALKRRTRPSDGA